MENKKCIYSTPFGIRTTGKMAILNSRLQIRHKLRPQILLNKISSSNGTELQPQNHSPIRFIYTHTYLATHTHTHITHEQKSEQNTVHKKLESRIYMHTTSTKILRTDNSENSLSCLLWLNLKWMASFTTKALELYTL